MVGQVEKSKKKKSIFINGGYKSYLMKLTSEPRLFLNEMPKEKGGRLNYQKDIMVNKGLQCNVIKKNQFQIKCQFTGKIQIFKTDKASDWVQKINQII